MEYLTRPLRRHERDAIIVIDDADLVVIGAAHLARGPGYVEVGVSVLPGYRGRGVGNALLERAKLHARNWGGHEIFTHCAAYNRAMAELAKRHGMRGVVDRGEADAYAEVPAPDASSLTIEMMAERAAALDHALKEQLVAARRLAFAWMPVREIGRSTSGVRSRARPASHRALRSRHDLAAVRVQQLPAVIAGFIRSEKDVARGHILRRAEALQRQALRVRDLHFLGQRVEAGVDETR